MELYIVRAPGHLYIIVHHFYKQVERMNIPEQTKHTSITMQIQSGLSAFVEELTTMAIFILFF